MHSLTLTAFLAIAATVLPVSATWYNCADNTPCYTLTGTNTCNYIGNLPKNAVGQCANVNSKGVGSCQFSCADNYTPTFSNGKLTCTSLACKSSTCTVPSGGALVNCNGSGGSCDYTCPTGKVKACNGVAGCTTGPCVAPLTCKGVVCSKLPGITSFGSTCGSNGACAYTCPKDYLTSYNGAAGCFAPAACSAADLTCGGVKCNTLPHITGFAKTCTSANKCDYSCPANYQKTCNGQEGCFASCNVCNGRKCDDIENAIVQSQCSTCNGGCEFQCKAGYAKTTQNGQVVCVPQDVLNCGDCTCKKFFDIGSTPMKHASYTCPSRSTCDYTCPNGTQKKCNGVEGCFISCPAQGTGVPARRRRDAIIHNKRTTAEQVKLALTAGPSPTDGAWGSVLCPKSQKACTVPGSINNEWECVDTLNDFSSCGGCMGLHGKGTDCEALPNVLRTSCGNGSCVIHSCLPGYWLQKSQTGSAKCVPKASVSLHPTRHLASPASS